MITGIHHISIMSGHAQETIDFYTSVLGLRLVKQTLNFDDSKMYHLYFGNNQGDIGTLITFFPQTITKDIEVAFNNNAATIFRIPKGTMPYWINRLNSFNIETIKRERFNKIYLAFSDMHNVKYELVEDENGIELNYSNSPVSKANALLGFYGVVFSSRAVNKTKEFLANQFNLKLIDENHMYYRFVIKGHYTYYLDLTKQDIPINRNNLGNIHHIAFSISNTLLDWKNKLNKNNYYSSAIANRTYFESLYFNEPGANLFELATNDKTLLVDEDIDTLGNNLIIPKKYENDVKVEDLNLMPLFNKIVSKLESYPYIDKKTYDTHIAHKALLARINELARKNKTKEGLSEQEKAERAILRKKYVSNILRGVSNTIDQVRVVDEEGNESKLVKKEKK